MQFRRFIIGAGGVLCGSEVAQFSSNPTNPNSRAPATFRSGPINTLKAGRRILRPHIVRVLLVRGYSQVAATIVQSIAVDMVYLVNVAIRQSHQNTMQTRPMCFIVSVGFPYDVCAGTAGLGSPVPQRNKRKISAVNQSKPAFRKRDTRYVTLDQRNPANKRFHVATVRTRCSHKGILEKLSNPAWRLFEAKGRGLGGLRLPLPPRLPVYLNNSHSTGIYTIIGQRVEPG